MKEVLLVTAHGKKHTKNKVHKVLRLRVHKKAVLSTDAYVELEALTRRIIHDTDKHLAR